MKKISLFCLLAIISLASHAQQEADTLFDVSIKSPANKKNAGSIVFIDEAHNNFHTRDGRFKPFAKLLEKDGYQVKSSTQDFNKEILTQARILVIANAINEENINRWTLPTPSAFTDAEISSLKAWIKQGGSLLLIADHMPFPGSAEKLAAAFGIKFYNGFAMKKNSNKDIFTLKNGLQETTITKGRNPEEEITSLQTFTGQAFQVPDSAQSIITLNEEYQLLFPSTAWEFNNLTPSRSAETFSQGAFMSYGAGRIVVFGEAAMFTAQHQGGKNKFGMNAPTAKQNAQFVLNVIHWLDKIIN